MILYPQPKPQRPRSRLVPRVYAPGKVVDESLVKSEKPGHGMPEIDRRMLAGQAIDVEAPTTGMRNIPADNQETKRPRRSTDLSLGAGTRKRFPMKVGGTYHFVTDGVLRHGKALGWGRSGATLITPDGEYAVTWADLREGIHPEVAKSLDQEDRTIRPTTFTAEDIRPGAVVVFTTLDADGTRVTKSGHAATNTGRHVGVRLRDGRTAKVYYDQIEDLL